MNLFYLDSDLDKCAEYHVDSHVGKMQLETAQMLCTNHWIDYLFGYIPRSLNSLELKELKELMKGQRSLPQEKRAYPYLACHHNHPCTIWIRESLDNYAWAVSYAQALSSEQKYRTGGDHKSFTVIQSLPDPQHLRDIGPTPFKMAMPDFFKGEDPIESYRLFYMGDKRDFAKWKSRQTPPWWDDELAETCAKQCRSRK